VGDWKLVALANGRWELYDLARDRGETHNLAAQQPDRIKQLEALWLQHMEETRKLATRDSPPPAPPKNKRPST